MYDPTIGRWTTEDPIGFEAADADLFRYVHNNPTNLTDPTGLQQGMQQGMQQPMKPQPGTPEAISQANAQRLKQQMLEAAKQMAQMAKSDYERTQLAASLAASRIKEMQDARQRIYDQIARINAQIATNKDEIARLELIGSPEAELGKRANTALAEEIKALNLQAERRSAQIQSELISQSFAILAASMDYARLHAAEAQAMILGRK
jgi:uncharacterized protein RhaS with RHS repeats